jgi:peptidoglycan/xylan/chitin deacetylase (PgdA/CDA1 family)
MWNDRVSWAFSESTRPSIAIDILENRYQYSLRDGTARSYGAADLTEKLKRVPQPVLQSILDELLRVAEVELPTEIPRRFLPLTWSDVSRCASQGVTFGPHTITHPILSQVDDARAAFEIQGSWQRLRDNTAAAIPVFCYPNGDYASYSDRERRTLASVGMRAAVVYDEHFATSRWAHARGVQNTLELPRFPYPDDTAQFRQIVGGMERLKQRVRSVVHLSSLSGAER